MFGSSQRFVNLYKFRYELLKVGIRRTAGYGHILWFHYVLIVHSYVLLILILILILIYGLLKEVLKWSLFTGYYFQTMELLTHKEQYIICV